MNSCFEFGIRTITMSTSALTNFRSTDGLDRWMLLTEARCLNCVESKDCHAGFTAVETCIAALLRGLNLEKI